LLSNYELMNKQKTWKIVFLSILAVVTLFIISINLQLDFIQIENLSYDGIPKAVIIDQLHNDKPNINYQQNVTEYLETAGYKVDLYTTDDITVDFYKKLPSMNYKYIVFRTHALGNGTIEESASLFTGEIHSDYEYIQDQYTGHVGKAVPYLVSEVEELGGLEALLNETYFVVGSKFVDDIMVGTFPNSVIILGGCETSKETFLVESLLFSGASDVVGWNGLVNSKQNDEVIMEVLKETLVNSVDIKDAVHSVMKEYDQKLITSAILTHYSTRASESND